MFHMWSRPCAGDYSAKPLLFVPKCLRAWGDKPASFVRLYPESHLVSVDDGVLFACHKPLHPLFISDPFRKFLAAATHVGLTRGDNEEYLIFITRNSEIKDFSFEPRGEQAFGMWAVMIPDRKRVSLLRYVIRLQRFARARLHARHKALAFVMGCKLNDDLLRVIVRMSY